MRTFQAVRDAARDAQRLGIKVNLAEMDAAADEALRWLDDVALDEAFANIRRW